MAVRALHDIRCLKLPVRSSCTRSCFRPSSLRTNHLCNTSCAFVCKQTCLLYRLHSRLSSLFCKKSNFVWTYRKFFCIYPKFGHIRTFLRICPKIMYLYASTNALVSLAIANSSLVGIIKTLTWESGVEISTISRARTLFFSRSIFTPMYSKPSQAS